MVNGGVSVSTLRRVTLKLRPASRARVKISSAASVAGALARLVYGNYLRAELKAGYEAHGGAG